MYYQPKEVIVDTASRIYVNLYSCFSSLHVFVFISDICEVFPVYLTPLLLYFEGYYIIFFLPQ